MTEEKVIEIRERIANGEYPADLAREEGMPSSGWIREIVKGRQYAHFGGPIITDRLPQRRYKAPPGEDNPNVALTAIQVRWILRDFDPALQGWQNEDDVFRVSRWSKTAPEIADRLGVSPATIRAIRIGANWTTLYNEEINRRKELLKQV